MNNTFNFDTDGGSINITTNINNPIIGYTDGCPYTDSKYDPFEFLRKKEEKILGFNYGYMANKGQIVDPKGIHSQNALYELGVNWVCLAVANYQKTYSSTHIYADYERTPTDRDIERFVQRAHANGIKVCLKPMLNCEDNMWRAYISFPDNNMDENNIYWTEWFDNYKHFILKYAELAEELNCEMFCIGCEMLGTEHRKYEWEYLIDEIRKIYNGKLIYNTNHDHEEDAEWISKLDYLGTSAYYPVGINGHTKEDMIKEWKKVKDRINKISEKLGKKYIFMEIGCRSAETCSETPWDFYQKELPVNEQEQADFYESCMDVFLKEDNFAGIFWWEWPTYIYDTREEASKDNGFSIHLKKAEKVLKDLYKR